MPRAGSTRWRLATNNILLLHSGAPGDRQRAKVKVLNGKGIANQTGPESCVAHREVRDEALTGEPAGQPLSRESNKLVQGADAVRVAEGDTDRRDSASAWMTLRGLRPWHVGTLFAREPGDLLLGRPRCAEWSVSGRRGVEAADERAGEVRPLHSSDEAGEQTWATGCGVGGAKGEDRGEHRRATHVPDSEPEKRVPEARLGTRSCSWASSLVTRGGSPVRELRPPGSVRGVPSNGHPYRDRVPLINPSHNVQKGDLYPVKASL